MKFWIGKDKLYLLLAYFALAAAIRLLFADYIAVATPWQPVIFLTILAIIVLSHEPLLKAIRQITGNFTSKEQGIFNEVLELNKKIQNYTEAGKVLNLVKVVLKDQLPAEKVIIYLNENIQPEAELDSRKWSGREITNNLLPWTPVSENAYELKQELIRNIIVANTIISSKENPSYAQEMFRETDCDLAIPVVYDRQLLCLILVRHFHAGTFAGYSEEELKILEYLSGQLALILDRIRVYQQMMLRTAMDHAEKVQVMQSISSNIAHEMRTPLSGIRASISGVEEYLPDLIAGYNHSISGSLTEVNVIRDDHLKSLKATPERITLMIDQANNVIDMLLMNLRETSLDENQMNVCSVRECIEQALERYPFKSAERDKVDIDLLNDFKFLGIESMFIYVIFNLLKNALYSIRSAQKGRIYISLDTGVRVDPLDPNQAYNVVYFRDTGLGMPEEIRERVFDSFYTTKEGGTGAGLAYCRRTIQNFGGKIECESVVGEYSEFKIYLPEINIFS